MARCKVGHATHCLSPCVAHLAFAGVLMRAHGCICASLPSSVHLRIALICGIAEWDCVCAHVVVHAHPTQRHGMFVMSFAVPFDQCRAIPCARRPDRAELHRYVARRWPGSLCVCAAVQTLHASLLSFAPGPVFVLGVCTFLLGMAANIHADFVLTQLRVRNTELLVRVHALCVCGCVFAKPAVFTCHLSPGLCYAAACWVEGDAAADFAEGRSPPQI